VTVCCLSASHVFVCAWVSCVCVALRPERFFFPKASSSLFRRAANTSFMETAHTQCQHYTHSHTGVCRHTHKLECKHTHFAETHTHTHLHKRTCNMQFKHTHTHTTDRDKPTRASAHRHDFQRTILQSTHSHTVHVVSVIAAVGHLKPRTRADFIRPYPIILLHSEHSTQETPTLCTHTHTHMRRTHAHTHTYT